jgi:diaminopimelate epimerase
MTTLTLTKHHGHGNDFLVLVDLEGRQPINAALARFLCDRHTGVGADGVMRVTAGTEGADVTMQLRNADGSLAEMSGNGIRCLAQAVVDAGIATGPELTVATAAGIRRLTVEPGPHPAEVRVSVDMGPAKVGPEEPQPTADRGVRPVDMGNPHLVVWGPAFTTEDVHGMGAEIESRTPGGVNVEFVTLGPGPDELTMRVWERGVGETMACGTGASAAAAACHEWGLVGPRVVVHQPGGDAEVEVRPDAVVLTGPARRVARVDVEVPPEVTP